MRRSFLHHASITPVLRSISNVRFLWFLPCCTKTNEFCINGYSIVKGRVIPDRYLAIETDKVKEDLFRNPESILSSETAFFDKIVTECYGAGREKILPINTIAPIYGKPALWIDENIKMQAQIHGYMVLEPSAVIMAHFQEMIRQHADSFFPEKA